MAGILQTIPQKTGELFIYDSLPSPSGDVAKDGAEVGDLVLDIAAKKLYILDRERTLTVLLTGV